MKQKQLAEKVARCLGWRQEELGWMMRYDESVMNEDFQGQIFSWPTVGLAIAQARAWGWRIDWQLRGVLFQKSGSNKFTKRYDDEVLGDITAILSAFAEIPKPVGKEIL